MELESNFMILGFIGY